MKLKLPLLLLQTVLLLQSSFAKEVFLESNSTPQSYTEAITVNTHGDSLIYTGSSTPFQHLFTSTTSLNFQGDYSLVITNCLAAGNQGLIYAQEDLSFRNLKSLTLSTIRSTSSSSIIETKGSLLFDSVGHIEINGNLETNTGSPALIRSNGSITFTNTRNITISKNAFANGGSVLLSDHTDSGIYFSHVGDIVLSFNEARILNSPNISFTYIKSLRVEGNISFGNGGAIHIESYNFNPSAQHSLSIQYAGEVQFLNNHSALYGGAIASVGISNAPPSILLSADNGDMTFKGNTHSGSGKLVANAITFMPNGATHSTSPGELILRAREGAEITFYDPIITLIELDIDKQNLSTIKLNQSDHGTEYKGIIRFDGSKVTEYIRQNENESDLDYQNRLDISRHSDLQGNTSLEGGSLILTNHVVYGRKIADLSVDTTFTFQKGILEISGYSQLHASNFIVTGLTSIFRMDNSSIIDTKTFTADSGISFDVGYWTNNENANVIIHADKASFSGVIGMHDGFDTYSDNQWANTLRFNLLDASQVSDIEKDFSGIQSSFTGSSTVNSPYQYQGEWTYEWVGTQLVGIWNPLGGITDVNPELKGAIVSNSMWSSASNAKSLSSAALGNVNILRLQAELKNNFWMKAMGDLAYDDSTAELDGYSYQSGGYAAGADFKVGKQSLIGVAFGQLMGDNKSELYNSKIKQESMMGSIYAAHLQMLNKRNSLLWTFAATYGDTENSMNTRYSDGQSSAGTWNNNAYFVEAKMEWRINPKGKSWTYKPFIGVEYTDVNLESFTETGDKARFFDEGSYKSLALPIGMGFEHQSHLAKKTWLNSFSLAYVPDLYRDAPSTQATRLSNGFSWKDQGSKPSIHTLRATINSTLQLNAAWTAYVSYTFEGRERASHHNLNTGVSYSF